MPLAPNSSFLTAAYDNGQAPSTAIGIYAGSNSIEAPDEGLVVIGGFDSTGFEGNLTDLDYDPNCPACFDVQSITYDTEEATTELLDGPMHAIFWFGADDVTLPLPAYNRFVEASSPEDGGSMTRGNFTMRLTSGFELTIPSHELFRPQRNYTDAGRLEILDPELEAFVDSHNGTSESFHNWGMPFLSQVYLAYDYDRHTKKIAKARRLDRRLALEAGETSERQIETVCPPVSSGSRGPPAGAIAGGVIGGVVSLILAAVGIWFFLRRRRSRRSSGTHASSRPSYDFPPDDKQGIVVIDSPDSPISGTSELAHSPSTSKSRTELPERHNMLEMPGHEPTELDAKEQEIYDELKFDKAERDCLYEMGTPTPTRTHFNR